MPVAPLLDPAVLDMVATALAPELRHQPWATPGEMAVALDRTTVQTPALELIDQHLAAVGHLPGQHRDHRRAIRLVLDQLQHRLRPLGRELTERRQRVDEVHPREHLVDQVPVRAAPALHLTGDQVGVLGVLEGQVPAEEQVVEPDHHVRPVLADQPLRGIGPEEPDGSKQARAAAVSPLIESGNVWLPSPELAPWIGGFIDECAGLPTAAHDDQVDAMSQALKRLVLDPLLAGDELVTEEDLDDELADFTIAPY